MSAPAARSARPCAAASSAPGNRPPSEKLSGVTLTMPMTSGRASDSPAQSGRGALNDASRASMCCSSTAPRAAAQLRSRGSGANAESTASPRRAKSSTAEKPRGPPASGSANPPSIARAAVPPARNAAGQSQAHSASSPSASSGTGVIVDSAIAAILPSPGRTCICCNAAMCCCGLQPRPIPPIYPRERRFGVSSLNLGRACRGPFFCAAAWDRPARIAHSRRA